MKTGAVAMVVFGALAIASLQREALARGTHMTQGGKRVVFMEITVPKKGVPPMGVTTHEDETATLSVDGVGNFGFQPTIPKDDTNAVVVAIFDLGSTPSRRLGDVKVPIAGTVVQSKTTPSFGIRVLRVVQPK
jgi:hypothetical protein